MQAKFEIFAQWVIGAELEDRTQEGSARDRRRGRRPHKWGSVSRAARMARDKVARNIFQVFFPRSTKSHERPGILGIYFRRS